MRMFYVVILATALTIALIALWRFPLPGDNIAAFYVVIFGGRFGITAHGVLDFLALWAFVWVGLKSYANYLMVVDVKHSTVISKK